jgi:hypothetical protein
LRTFEEEATRRVLTGPGGGTCGDVQTAAGTYAVLVEAGAGVARGGRDSDGRSGGDTPADGDGATGTAEEFVWLQEIVSDNTPNSCSKEEKNTLSAGDELSRVFGTWA